MYVKVWERKGMYRYLIVGLFTLLFSISLAVTACEKQSEDANVAYQRGDYAKAYRLMKPMAEQGDAQAQYNLGHMYRMGRGVPQDYAEAANWFRKAAEQGEANAQNSLGVMYSEGQGVPRDFVLAHMWFNLAVSRFPASEGEKRETIEFNIALVASKMTPFQIAEAERLAREWKPKKEVK